jgi:hypothetical protein
MPVFKTIIDLLFFRICKQALISLSGKHLAAGLVGTWLAGIGRYWDDPGAKLLQKLGLGSVIYIFLLAVLIWAVVKPFRIKEWSYFRVLTFISLTSFPAILYAIPVERYYSIGTANTVNVWFLAVVASWRLALLFFFFKRMTPLRVGEILTITLLPICVIISTLTVLNLHRVVFNIMGGIRNPSPHDGAYAILIMLTVVSLILVLPLLALYLISIYQHKRVDKNDEKG